jgi:hypothetical protein
VLADALPALACWLVFTLAPAPPFETDALPEREPAAVVCPNPGAASTANASKIVADAFIYLFLL